MKALKILVLAIAILAVLPSCQPTSAQIKELANKEKRVEIMNAIAHDSSMSQEMMRTLMNAKNGRQIMQKHRMQIMENDSIMMGVLKNNPHLMQSMMDAMMETAKGDSSIMYGMIRSMMRNTQMRGMMQNMMGNNGNRMMHNMGGMGYRYNR